MTANDEDTPDARNKVRDALEDVRNAYRLLHNFQRLALDATKYIGDQLGLTFKGGYPHYSNRTPNAGNQNLTLWAWDWLNMYCYEFQFARTDETVITLSILLISDTGFFMGNHASKIETSRFLPAEDSKTCIGFVMSNGAPTDTSFTGKSEDMKAFLKDGKLPAEYERRGIVGLCYPFECLTSKASTDALIDKIVAESRVAGLALSRILVRTDT